MVLHRPGRTLVAGDTRSGSRGSARRGGRRARHGRRRPAPANPSFEDAEPAFAPEALDAHAAGVQDAVEALAEPRPRPARKPIGVRRERRRTRETSTTTATGDEKTTRPELLDLSDRAPGVPDIMVCPNPCGPADGGPGPRAGARTDRLRVRPADPDRLAGHPGVLDPNRAAQIENSQFWLTDEERAAAGSAWPIPEARAGTPAARPGGPARETAARRPRHRAGRRRADRAGRPRPGRGVLRLGQRGAVLAGRRATATRARHRHPCTGSGVTQRCFGLVRLRRGALHAPPGDPARRRAGASGTPAPSPRPGWSARTAGRPMWAPPGR